MASTEGGAPEKTGIPAWFKRIFARFESMCSRIETPARVAASLAIVAGAVYGGWEYNESARQTRIERSEKYYNVYESKEVRNELDIAKEFDRDFADTGRAKTSLLTIVRFFDEAYACVKYEYCDRESMSRDLSSKAKEFWGLLMDVGPSTLGRPPEFALEELGIWEPWGFGTGLECIRDNFDCDDYNDNF